MCHFLYSKFYNTFIYFPFFHSVPREKEIGIPDKLIETSTAGNSVAQMIFTSILPNIFQETWNLITWNARYAFRERKVDDLSPSKWKRYAMCVQV